MRRDVGRDRPPGLGIAAFCAASTALVAGAVLLFVAGSIYGPAAPAIAGLPAGGAVEDLPADVQSRIADATTWFNVGFSTYALLAIWGGVMGVTAFIRRQGRRWAFWAVAVALVGGVVSLMAGALGLSLTAV